MDRLATPLARVRGLGSAKEGVNHWWAQRVTAIALVPLLLWFVCSIISLSGATHADVVAFVGSPFPALLLVLMLGAGFYHAALGLQVVLEDYVHHEGVKIGAILAVKALCFILAGSAILAVLKLVFKG